MSERLSEARRDEVARDAARLLRDGRAKDIPSAILAALRGGAGAEQVSAARVREHARGMAMEAMGEVGYAAHVADVLCRAEETMTLLATQLATRAGDARVVLVGRGARGQVDADPCCRIRIETDATVGDIAAVLVSAGMEEPGFATVESRFGRLDQLRVDDGGVETRILRLQPNLHIPLDADLRSEGRVPALALTALRGLILALNDRDCG